MAVCADARACNPNNFVGFPFRSCVDRPQQPFQARPSLSFDLDVDHDEPLFIQATEKILQQHNIIELNRLRRIKSAPVVQCVGNIGKDRRTAQLLGDLIPRPRKLGGELRPVSPAFPRHRHGRRMKGSASRLGIRHHANSMERPATTTVVRR